MWNQTVRCRIVLFLGALLWTSFAPALPFAAAQQTPPPAHPQSPADKAATDELDQINKEGVSAAQQGDFPTAMKAFQTGLDKAQALKNEKYIAKFLNNVGNVYNSLGQYDQALDFHQGALTLREKLGNQKDIAGSLNNIGNVYDHLGQYEKALDCYQRALTIKENLGNPQDIALSLLNVGNVYNSLGQYDQALDFHQRALTLYEKLGNQKDIAYSLENIGNVYYALGQYEKALDCYGRALTIKEKLGNPQDIADSLNNIGNVYYLLGQNDKALDYHQRALTIREKIGIQQNIARSLLNIGNVYWSLGQNDKALDFLLRSLTIREKIGNERGIASCLDNIGNVYWSLGQNDKALDYLQRALPLLEKIGNPQDIASSLLNIGNVYSDLGQNEKAFDCYQRALAIREKLGNPQDIASSLNSIGVVYVAQKQWDKAEDAYSRARRIFESFSQQVGDPTQLADLQQTMGHFYERYADLLTQEKRSDAALALLEAGRAKGIARQLFLNRSGFSKALTPEEAATLTQRLTEMNAATNRLQAEAQKSEVEQKNKDDYANKARDAERKYDAYNVELFKRYPQFRSESGDISVSPKDLRSLADNNPDTLFLTWAILDEKRTNLYALGKRDGLTAYTLPIGEKELTAKVGDWLFALTNGRRDSDAAPSAGEMKRAKALYAALLGPLTKAGLLAKGRYRRIVVVPSGPLLELPFAALMDASGRRLIENYAVSSKVALNTSFWSATPAGGKSAPALPSMLCVADPIGTAPTKEEQLALRRGGFGPLPGARQEGEAVAGLFHAFALVGPQAKKADVLRAMPGVKLLHFATHGYLNSKSPFYSGLVLAPEPAGSSDDGVLSAREILNLPLSAKMAVLSACETGRGVAKGGDGLQGLVWAFQAAGCPCVVASQWQVDDEATRELMLAFYRNLQKAGTRKDEAMRSAMLLVKKEKPSPFFWAAFEVIGDTGAL